MADERVFALEQKRGANLTALDVPLRLKFLRAEQVIGRSERSDLEVPVPTMSRRHAAVWLEDDTPRVRDLDSGHGTFVNAERIHEPTTLKAGDDLGFGTDVIFVLVEEGRESPAEEAIPSEPEAAMSPLVELALSDGTSEERLREFFRGLVRLQDRVGEFDDEKDVLDAVVDEIWRRVPADRVIAFRGANPDKLVPIAWRQRHDEVDPTKKPPSRSILTRGLLASKPLITFDAQNDQRFSNNTSVTLSNIRSVMCVPLRSPIGPYGLLYADTLGSTGLHSGDDANFFTVVASYVGLKLHDLYQRREVRDATPSNMGPQIKKHLSHLELLADDVESESGNSAVSRILRAECAKLRDEFDLATSREIGAPEGTNSAGRSTTQSLTEIPED